MHRSDCRPRLFLVYPVADCFKARVTDPHAVGEIVFPNEYGNKLGSEYSERFAGSMKNIFAIVISGAVVTIFYNVIATPFLEALLNEFSIRPAEWANPTAQYIRDTLSSQKFQIGVSGAAGALTYTIIKHWVRRSKAK